MTTNTNKTYNKLVVILHWLIVLLFIGVYTTIEIKGFFPKGSALRDGLKHWHFMLGMGIFFLALIRVVVRLLTKAPPITPEPPKVLNLLAKVGHLALYGLMIMMPLAGWMMFSANGYAVPFFGLELPPLIDPVEGLGAQIREVHETIGTIGLFLIALHAAAALFHHYILKDDTLKRMR